MKWGVNICSDVGRWSVTSRQAKHAEELGFDSLWLPEHHVDGYLGSPLTALAGLASSTTTIALGTDVAIAPLYQPLRLAEETAQIQEMSAGRLILGLAIGYREAEFEAFGVDLRRRGVLLEECLLALSALWRGVPLEGVRVGDNDYPLLSAGLPQIPVWLGGWAEKAVRRAARMGDAWFPGPTADVAAITRCLDIYSDELAAAGRARGELPIFREVWVANSQEELDYGVRSLDDFYGDHYTPYHDNVADVSDVGANRFITGFPDQVVDQIIQLSRGLGITHMICRLHIRGRDGAAVEKSMGVLAEKVRPAVEAELAEGMSY